MKHLNKEKIRIFNMVVCVILLLCSCSQSEFDLPNGFALIPHDKNSDNILAVNYKNEMKIIVSLESSKLIKQSNYFGSAVMKNAFQVKILKYMSTLNAKNESELSNYHIDNHMYINQTFDFVSDSTEAYFEYGTLCIKEPEEYYELFISGNKIYQEQHREKINQLLETIIKYHFSRE